MKKAGPPEGINDHRRSFTVAEVWGAGNFIDFNNFK